MRFPVHRLADIELVSLRIDAQEIDPPNPVLLEDGLEGHRWHTYGAPRPSSLDCQLGKVIERGREVWIVASSELHLTSS